MSDQFRSELDYSYLPAIIEIDFFVMIARKIFSDFEPRKAMVAGDTNTCDSL